MRIRATFIGTNGSMGYVRGREYALHVLQPHGRPRIVGSDTGDKPVPCANWPAFWRNWQRIP